MRSNSFAIVVATLLTAFSAHAAPTWESARANDWQRPVLTENTGALVFIRANQSAETGSSTNIAVNNRYLTSLENNRYSTAVVCAGAVQISVNSAQARINSLTANAINVALLPNQVQFVYVEVDSQDRPSLRAINEMDAMILIASSSRQVHQISRTKADNCQAPIPTEVPTPTEVPVQDPVPEFVPPPVISIVGIS